MKLQSISRDYILDTGNYLYKIHDSSIRAYRR